MGAFSYLSEVDKISTHYFFFPLGAIRALLDSVSQNVVCRLSASELPEKLVKT